MNSQIQADQAPAYIRSDKLMLVVNSKSSLYDACIRNDILLPPLKDPFITYELLEMVWKK